MHRSWIIAVALGGLMALLSFERSGRLHPGIYQYEIGETTLTDVWFSADLPARACTALGRDAGQNRITAEHPLLPILSFVPVAALRAVGVAPIDAMRWSLAVQAAIWIALLFAILHTLTGSAMAAALFSLVAAVSGAATFWTTVPELFTLGSISMLLPIAVARRTERAGRIATAVASAASLSVTTTNWIAGLLATAVSHSRRRAIAITAASFCLVTLAWLIQAMFFAHTRFFLLSERLRAYLPEIPQPDLSEALTSFFVHSMVMGEVATFERSAQWLNLSIQIDHIATSWLGLLAIACWIALLVLGSWQLVAVNPLRRLRIAIAGIIAAQLALHLLIGFETFLYAMHYLPLLICIAAIASTAPATRVVALTLASVLVVTAGANNQRELSRATGIVNGIAHAAAGSATLPPPASKCEW